MEFFPSQVGEVAEAVLKEALSRTSPDHACLVTLSGDLGAGKTTLAKAVAERLGVTESLQSPTFVIYKMYDLSDGAPAGLTRLVHGDMYRLESAEEIERLGWSELLADPRNLILIEWPEMIRGAIPPWATSVFLGHSAGGETRTVEIK